MANVETEVLLLNGVVGTNRLWRTIGPYQIAWWLREHGYQPQVIDFFPYLGNTDFMKILDHFITEKTKIIAWGLMGSSHEQAGEAIKVVNKYIPAVRKKYPWVKFVAGGPWSYYCCQRWPNRTAFDYFVTGYAENGMLAICEKEIRNGAMPAFELVSGNKVIKDTTPCHLPSEKLFDIHTSQHRWHDRDCIVQGESLPIELGRGCIFKCSFCAFPHIGKKNNDFRRDIAKVEEEMLYNNSKFGTTHYYIIDDTFNDSNDKVNEFHAMTRRLPFKIKFGCYLRPDLLDSFDSQAHVLQDAGLLSGYLGIETFNEQSAQAIKKPWSAKRGRQYLQELRNNIWKDKVSFKASMIIGLPHGTESEYREYQQWFIDNGIPNWSWKTLFLSRDLTRPFISEFDREASKYGYEWELENGVPVWKSQWFKYREARELMEKLDNEKSQLIAPDTWDLLEMQNYGVDPSENLFTKTVVLQTVNLANKRKKFIEIYKQNLLSL